MVSKNIPMTDQAEHPECCPKFDPIPWENKVFEWDNKRFIKDHLFTVFYMPFSFGKVIRRLNEKIEASGAESHDFMTLSEHTSSWNMNLLVAVSKEVADADNLSLQGRFYSKVYEGPFKDAGNWHKDFMKTTKEKGFEVKKCYYWYTTCPKCAKKYGKNYTVLIGQIG
jgi:hypothetical protein